MTRRRRTPRYAKRNAPNGSPWEAPRREPTAPTAAAGHSGSRTNPDRGRRRLAPGGRRTDRRARAWRGAHPAADGPAGRPAGGRGDRPTRRPARQAGSVAAPHRVGGHRRDHRGRRPRRVRAAPGNRSAARLGTGRTARPDRSGGGRPVHRLGCAGAGAGQRPAGRGGARGGTGRRGTGLGPAERRVAVAGRGHRDPATARSDPPGGDAGPHPVVADPVAHRARRAGDPRAGASGAQPAEPAGRDRAGGADHR